MEEVKSKGKLKGFTGVIISAAQGRADAARAEADEQEKATLEDYRKRAREEGERRTAQALAEAKAREEKRLSLIHICDIDAQERAATRDAAAKASAEAAKLADERIAAIRADAERRRAEISARFEQQRAGYVERVFELVTGAADE